MELKAFEWDKAGKVLYLESDYGSIGDIVTVHSHVTGKSYEFKKTEHEPCPRYIAYYAKVDLTCPVYGFYVATYEQIKHMKEFFKEFRRECG